MKIYCIERSGEIQYEEKYCITVLAPNEAMARKLASKKAGKEGPNPWLNKDLSSCEELKINSLVINDQIIGRTKCLWVLVIPQCKFHA